ncbi:unnamed protein product [Lactuca virosa]|uniref:IPT/TIG domain-containing protein n=1 Tax=Lactuca virosa TaxID=75947 RepID=A0AAU9P7N8_9ASTR|nr:unnamed protein product [Lactuca virosa]
MYERLHTSPHHQSFLHRLLSTVRRPPCDRPPESPSTGRTDHRTDQKLPPSQPSTDTNAPLQHTASSFCLTDFPSPFPFRERRLTPVFTGTTFTVAGESLARSRLHISTN